MLLVPAIAVAQRVSEAPEPNSSTTTATTVACGIEAVGALSSVTDEDWYELVLTATADVCVTAGPGAGVEVRDTIVTLLDGTGGPLRQNDDCVQAGFYSELLAPALPPGTYFVAVTAGAQAVAGSYQLDISCRASATTSTPSTVTEGPENNDPRTGGTATSAIVPVRASGALQSTGVDGDWDFWKLLVFGDSVLRVTLEPTNSIPSGAAQDPVVYLYDDASPPNVVAGPFFASARDAWDQVLEFRVDGGVHHIAVRGAEGSQPGSYLLDVTSTTAAAGLVFSGGCGGRTLSLATSNFGPGAPLVREYPRLGTTYSVQGSNLGAGGYCYYAVGVQGQFVDLSPLGAPGCALEVVPIQVQFQFADASGDAAWSLPIPDSVSLVGAQLHSQVAVFDLSNPLGLTMSNRVVGLIAN